MLGLGLKLLGIGKFLKEFFLNNWKWIVPLALVIAAFLWTKEHYYTEGLNEERATWEKKLEAERKRNQELTQALSSSVATFGEVVKTRNEERVSTETIRENRINTIIEEKPVYTECKVDQEVVDQQNAIKALGPRP
jgi:uncharacterized protein YlxW (UPF0749 family)